MSSTTLPRLFNYTPHAVTFVLPDGKSMTIASDGDVRCTSETQRALGNVLVESSSSVSVPLTTPQVFNGIEPATIHVAGASGIIVAAVVGEYMSRTRTDPGVPVYSPGVLVRDEKGAIVGTRGLVAYRISTD